MDDIPGHSADLPVPNLMYWYLSLGILSDQYIFWYIGDKKEHLLTADLHCNSYCKIICVKLVLGK